MTNARIPAFLRDRLPLLVCGDAVVWVPGWRADQRFIVGPETGAMLEVRFVRLPD
jgi:hypothetical protein